MDYETLWEYYFTRIKDYYQEKYFNIPPKQEKFTKEQKEKYEAERDKFTPTLPSGQPDNKQVFMIEINRIFNEVKKDVIEKCDTPDIDIEAGIESILQPETGLLARTNHQIDNDEYASMDKIFKKEYGDDYAAKMNSGEIELSYQLMDQLLKKHLTKEQYLRHKYNYKRIKFEPTKFTNKEQAKRQIDHNEAKEIFAQKIAFASCTAVIHTSLYKDVKLNRSAQAVVLAMAKDLNDFADILECIKSPNTVRIVNGKESTNQEYLKNRFNAYFKKSLEVMNNITTDAEKKTDINYLNENYFTIVSLGEWDGSKLADTQNALGVELTEENNLKLTKSVKDFANSIAVIKDKLGFMSNPLYPKCDAKTAVVISSLVNNGYINKIATKEDEAVLGELISGSYSKSLKGASPQFLKKAPSLTSGDDYSETRGSAVDALQSNVEYQLEQWGISMDDVEYVVDGKIVTEKELLYDESTLPPKSFLPSEEIDYEKISRANAERDRKNDNKDVNQALEDVQDKEEKLENDEVIKTDEQDIELLKPKNVKLEENKKRDQYLERLVFEKAMLGQKIGIVAKGSHAFITTIKCPENSYGHLGKMAPEIIIDTNVNSKDIIDNTKRALRDLHAEMKKHNIWYVSSKKEYGQVMTAIQEVITNDYKSVEELEKGTQAIIKKAQNYLNDRFVNKKNPSKAANDRFTAVESVLHTLFKLDNGIEFNKKHPELNNEDKIPMQIPQDDIAEDNSFEVEKIKNINNEKNVQKDNKKEERLINK